MRTRIDMSEFTITIGGLSDRDRAKVFRIIKKALAAHGMILN